MPEKRKTQPRFADLVGKVGMDILLRKIMDARKPSESKLLTEPDGVVYDEFTHEVGGKEYVVRPIHVTIDEVSEHGSGRCRNCNGKGYYTVNIAKTSLRKPHDHVILSKRPFDGITEQERETLIEEERKSKTWRVLLACECSVKALFKLDPNFYVSDDRGIMFRLEYEEKAKAG